MGLLSTASVLWSGTEGATAPYGEGVSKGPGETLRREIVDRRAGLLWRLSVLSCVLAVAIVDLIRWALLPWLKPWFWLVLIAPYSAYFAWKVVSSKREIVCLEKGYIAEKEVGEKLEDLRKNGCRVYHDVQGDGFNVDHVLVSNFGVFTIETKYASKQKGADNNIVHMGDHVTINGNVPPRNPVAQAMAQANWFGKNLREITGFEYYIKPVVIYHPNWFVKRGVEGANDHSDKHPVWVLNVEAFKKYYHGSRLRLDDQEVANLDYWINRFIMYNERTADKKRKKLNFTD